MDSRAGKDLNQNLVLKDFKSPLGNVLTQNLQMAATKKKPIQYNHLKTSQSG